MKKKASTPEPKPGISSSLKTGVSFGLTSGSITTLGLMVGLNSATNSEMVVIGGILTIAIADAFSDALGIHISEEAKTKDQRHIWEATFATLFTKFFFTLTFLVPVLLLPLQIGIYASIAWGALVISSLSFAIAKADNENPARVIGEHLLIMFLVLWLSHFVGDVTDAFFH